MREERGADPRPACSAGRTGGPLHAVLVTHPPRLLHARTGRTLSHSGSVVRDFSFSSQLDPAAPGGPAFVLRRAPPPAPAGPSFARKAGRRASAFGPTASARVSVGRAPAPDEGRPPEHHLAPSSFFFDGRQERLLHFESHATQYDRTSLTATGRAGAWTARARSASRWPLDELTRLRSSADQAEVHASHLCRSESPVRRLSAVWATETLLVA
jgi:hypothetical protein